MHEPASKIADIARIAIDERRRSLVVAVGSARDGLELLIHALAYEELGDNAIAAIELIRQCSGRIIVSGLGKSGHIARKLAATFSSTGMPAYYLHPAEASHGDLGMIDSRDVVLALSWSGETSEFAGILSHVKRFGVPLIAITAGPTSTLARFATIPLILPEVREACPLGLAPTTSTVLQLALGDALAVALLEQRGFTAAEFGVLHPGGRLGAQLKLVRDLMHESTRLPVVREATIMADAILEMSSKGFGIIGVLDGAGELVGVVTDGDLRRHMSRDLLDRRIETVMSRNPVVVAADCLAGEALKLMQERKIGVVFVVEQARPIGPRRSQAALGLAVGHLDESVIPVGREPDFDQRRPPGPPGVPRVADLTGRVAGDHLAHAKLLAVRRALGKHPAGLRLEHHHRPGKPAMPLGPPQVDAGGEHRERVRRIASHADPLPDRFIHFLFLRGEVFSAAMAKRAREVSQNESSHARAETNPPESRR